MAPSVSSTRSPCVACTHAARLPRKGHREPLAVSCRVHEDDVVRGPLPWPERLAQRLRGRAYARAKRRLEESLRVGRAAAHRSCGSARLPKAIAGEPARGDESRAGCCCCCEAPSSAPFWPRAARAASMGGTAVRCTASGPSASAASTSRMKASCRSRRVTTHRAPLSRRCSRYVAVEQ